MPHSQDSTPLHEVVIIGGGFGGLHAVRQLRRSPVHITLIDRRNFHLFQPLLYQVATGGLSPANIAAPLRHVLSRQRNVEVLLAEVIDIDAASKRVILRDGEVRYDSLIVAVGARHSYFGHDEWAPHAPGLKTIEDATEIRARVLTAFESAEREHHPEARRRLLNFVIVGGGPTGVELAGALAEIARHSLRHDFRAIDPSEARIELIEAGDRILTAFPEKLSQKAEKSLAQLGVHVRTNTKVTNVTDDNVTLESENGVDTVPTSTVLWAAGVQAARFTRRLAKSANAPMDRSGRIIVEKDLTLPGHPEIFVIGDAANYMHGTERPLPGVAPVAIQQGKFVAKLINARLQGKPLPEFKYHDLGSLATIGRSKAVADFGWLKISGLVAWVLWLFIHLMNLVSFRNRLLVLMQWGWSYISYDRAARLITGMPTPAQNPQDPHTTVAAPVPVTESTTETTEDPPPAGSVTHPETPT